VAWIDGQTYAAPTAELGVIDRIGGGDGFASASSMACWQARNRWKP